MVKRFGSSQNPEKLALRVKSLLLAIIPVIVLVAKMNGLDLAETDLQPYVDAIYNVIIFGGFIISGILHFWGWIRSFKK